jgi:predicted acylesterase/phospholipase RssA
MWRSVVLSSGGVLGEFQVGALDELKRRVDAVDLYCGAGVGALNATMLAMDTDLSSAVDSVIALWDEEILDDGNVFRTGLLGVPGGVLSTLITEGPHAKLGAIDPRPTRNIIERHSNWERLGRRKNWAVSTVSLTDGQLYGVSNDPALLERTRAPGQTVQLSLDPRSPTFIGAHFHDFVQAAAAVPLMFPPVPLFGHLFCEAGIRDYTPVALAAAGLEAAAAGDPDFEAEVIIIDTSGAALPTWGRERLDSGREIALRSMQVMISEMAGNDLTVGIARLKAAAPNVKVTLIRMPSEFEGFTMDFNDLPVREGLRKLGVTRAQQAFSANAPAPS